MPTGATGPWFEFSFSGLRSGSQITALENSLVRAITERLVLGQTAAAKCHHFLACRNGKGISQMINHLHGTGHN
jgi:hypothetical protein